MSTLPPGLRPVANPPNPWASTDVEYLDEVMGPDGPERGAPNARLQVIEDSTRKIIAENDSPDVGFRWSVNPYRGCFHACAYCMGGETPILMADGTTRPLASLHVGDAIYGTEKRGDYRRYTRTNVLAAWSTVKTAYRITLEDGTELVASGDHRFLTQRGWKFVTGKMSGAGQRPYLTLHNELMGVGRFAAPPAETDDYKQGYLCGMIRGDGLLGRGNGGVPPPIPRRREQTRRRRGRNSALIDFEGLARTQRYLQDVQIETREFVFSKAVGARQALSGIRTSARAHVERIRELVRWPAVSSLDWCKGFLAGIFDAEGCYSQGILRISNTDPEILRMTAVCLERLRFDAVLEDGTTKQRASTLRIRGGLREHLRFFHVVDPAIRRKRDIEGQAVKSQAKLRIVGLEQLPSPMQLFDITTGTGDFIANGVVSHNCYARPGHEYLSMGAGTDFDRKIVIKPEAPKLLREAFDKRSWKGEFVMFSGVTDCYQPLEASYRLTRGCLEVCAEYKNPCGVITKAPLIERDLDLLVELSRVTDFSVTLSIPFWDPDKARAIEPYVATPQRRMKAVERLAKAGVKVAVNVAPLIPGLGDEDVPAILEAARDAGASRANFVFLRLPGPVAVVFEERLRATLPLRAEKVLSRVREARGGKLYDSRFGARQVGEGPYAEAAMALFEATARRMGLATGGTKGSEDGTTTFERPPAKGQMRLF